MHYRSEGRSGQNAPDRDSELTRTAPVSSGNRGSFPELEGRMKTLWQSKVARSWQVWAVSCFVATTIGVAWGTLAQASVGLGVEPQAFPSPQVRLALIEEGKTGPEAGQPRSWLEHYLPTEPIRVVPSRRDRTPDGFQWDGIFWDQPRLRDRTPDGFQSDDIFWDQPRLYTSYGQMLCFE